MLIDIPILGEKLQHEEMFAGRYRIEQMSVFEHEEASKESHQMFTQTFGEQKFGFTGKLDSKGYREEEIIK